MKKALLFCTILILIISCEKDHKIYIDEVKTINVSDKIKIDNDVEMHDSIFNMITYNNFLQYLVSSDHFIIVQQKDFANTISSDKVIISLRHDVDYDIEGAIKMAYLENKVGVKATYFILHTADYYGTTEVNSFKRDGNMIYYLQCLQEKFGREVGWHNDLVTLQIVYNIDSREFLKDELEYLRANNIDIRGSASHGSGYCYDYHYVNAYFWKEYTRGSETFYNFETVKKDGKTITIEKDRCSSYNLDYEAGLIGYDYFFADVIQNNGERWNMGMVDFDTIQPGKKVVILLHPEHWN